MLDLRNIQIWKLIEVLGPVGITNPTIARVVKANRDWLYPDFVTENGALLATEGGLLIHPPNGTTLFDSGVRYPFAPPGSRASELDRFAVDQKASIAARIQFLKRVADTELYILPTHLAGPGFGRVRSRSKRWVFIGGSS